MSGCKNNIIILMKYPVPGQAKTRLIPALGPQGAARFHRRLAEHTVAEARKVQATAENNDVAITICFAGGRRKDFKAWLGPGFFHQPQASGDLGNRLQSAFERAFKDGAERVLAIGADIPALSGDIMRRASAISA